MKNSTVAIIGVFLVVALGLVFIPVKDSNRITGYAVSNVFQSQDNETETLGFIPRQAEQASTTIEASEFKLESAVILPSGRFTQDNYTAIIPYLGEGGEIPPAPPPPSGGRRGSGRREDEQRMGEVCDGSWQCSDWGPCQESHVQGECVQYRVCTVVSCEYTTEIRIPPKPSEVRGCPCAKEPEPEPAPKPQPKEGFVFYVRPKVDKDYDPGDAIVLHTYINNPDDKLENLEIEYNIDEGAKRSVYVEYEGVFDVSKASKFKKDISYSLEGYDKKRYKIHATLYKDGEKLAESYHDLDLR